jgi:DNA-binding Lrp family transcriptional regulator
MNSLRSFMDPPAQETDGGLIVILLANRIQTWENRETFGCDRRRSRSRMSDDMMIRPAGPGQMVVAPALDEVDRQIVEALGRDGRLSIRALADQIHISRANAYARVERLTATGVITGFTATVDPLKLGLATSAYVTLSLRQSSWRTLREQLQAIPEVKHMALVGGDFDAILLVRAADNEGLRRVVLEKLQAIPEVLATRTALIFEDLGTL